MIARIVVLILAFVNLAHAETRHYELTATRATVNLSGKHDVTFALMLNGSIPAPTLTFNEGDVAEIVVKNEIPGEELSVHWHGILLPVEEDGVPYVTTPPIPSGGSHTFRFPIRQNGTYWYHSHTNVQEQKGLYGAIVISPRELQRETKHDHHAHVDHDVVAVLSDWSDENATDILSNLRKDGDYYLFKKGTMRSWGGALIAGKLGAFLWNELTRMGGMDLSDVGYDAFLINGKRELQLVNAKPGQTVRLRLINASASSYVYVSLGGLPMPVVAADGLDVTPKFTAEVLLGMAETYDVLFTVPESKNYELRLTAQDGTGSASGWVGVSTGEKLAAPIRPLPDLYAVMDHSAHEAHVNHTSHAAATDHDSHSTHGAVIPTLTVDELQAPVATSFPATARVHEVKLELGGDMRRYIWHINGRAIYQDRTITIEPGDVVRFSLVNGTMMHHPMHLHGHFFRVLTSAGERSPLKHTVDVPPHATRTIEFLANEPGEWMLHCHNLYHLKTGMARVVKYSSYNPRPELAHLQKHDPHLHDHIYFYGRAEAATHHAQAQLRLSQTWNELELRAEVRNPTARVFAYDTPWEIEGDLLYRRWFTQYLRIGGGLALFDQRVSVLAGVMYTLPLLIEASVMIDHQAKFRFGLEKRFQWAKWVFTDFDFTLRPFQAERGPGADLEYEISLMFQPAWSWAGGLMLTDRTIGAGIQVQF